MITPTDINNAKAELTEATKFYHDSAVILANAKASLEREKANGLANGTIEGKNAELREAAARQILADEYCEVDRHQETFDAAELRYKLARIEDDRVSMLLRFAELTK